MTRAKMRDQVRSILRQLQTKPFDDADINTSLERGVDEVCNRVPFLAVWDSASAIQGQREYILQPDVLEILAVQFQPGAYDTLYTAIGAEDTTIVLWGTGNYAGLSAQGTVDIEGEAIDYSGVDTSGPRPTLIGCTRGARGTKATVHAGAIHVKEITARSTTLELVGERTLALESADWVGADPGVPTRAYFYNGVLGFDVAPAEDGYFNIQVRALVRPPAMATDADGVLGLLESFHTTIVTYACYDLGLRLATDDASVAQAARWLQDFLTDVALLEKRTVKFAPVPTSKMKPFSWRGTA